VEESIGYEELFSPEEWDSIVSDDWSGPDDGGSPKWDEPQEHKVFIGNPPGQYEGNEERFELECDICEHIGGADTTEEAQAIAKLHEAFVAALVENWSVGR